jgi:hypothetical protein
MADRQIPPNPQNPVVANAAMFILVAIFTAPALAATSSQIPCSESVQITLDVAVESLIAETVGHNVPAPSIIRKSSKDEVTVVSTTSFLVPRAEEAIRDAFAESDSAALARSSSVLSKSALNPPMAGTKSKAETDEGDDEDTVSRMNTRLPGVSDAAMSRYKKQMFRRDI